MTTEVHPVGQVVRYLQGVIERNRQLADLWVSGEVADLRQQSSGHQYFALRDRSGTLRCAFFRNRNAGQRDRLRNGAQVVLHGAMSLHDRTGNLSLIVDFVQPEGTGALAAEFERRRAAFEEAGLFAPERKRPLPVYPDRIGVVTSPSGAALQDVLSVLARRWPRARVLVQPTVVQGPGAAASVAAAIRALDEHAPDVVIVTRGGGSQEDLWAFNEEPVVRAIYGASAPVISAVGHETDTTLADLAADVRAATPSAAAELATPDRTQLLHRVEVLHGHLDIGITRTLAQMREATDLRGAALHRSLPRPAERRERVAALAGRSTRAAALALDRAAERLRAHASQLEALSPGRTLARGYAIVEGEHPTGGETTIVTSARAAHEAPGPLRLRFHDGALPIAPSGAPDLEPWPAPRPPVADGRDRASRDSQHRDTEDGASS